MSKLIFGNWKMNLSAKESGELAAELVKSKWSDNIELAVFPTFTALDAVRRAIGDAPRVKLGAQDCFWEEKGAFTGEVSTAQLAEFGCSYALVGHSERRQYLGETDAMVNAKLKAILAAGLTPVLCVGETDEARRLGQWATVIEGQINKALDGVEMENKTKIIVAYEPIWAIGTGRACDPGAAADAHALVMNTCSELYGQPRAEHNIKVIYGGSVDAKNIASYLEKERIDGALVGGASQKVGLFSALLEAAGK